jgi:alpha-L-arabinofuranosidase
LSVNTFEHQLYCVDAIRQMLLHGAERTFFHHIFGSYGCPAISANGDLRDNAKAFSLYSGRIGQVVLKTETQVETFDYDGQAGKWATDFNALAPATRKVPCMSALATRDGDQVHLLLLNRSTDRTVKAKVRLPVAPASAADVRTLSGEDYNTYGASLSQTTARLAKTFTREVAPHSAQMISFKVSSK